MNRKSFLLITAVVVLLAVTGLNDFKYYSGSGISSIELIPKAFAAGQTYYVATNGSDSTGDGSSAKPWKTINYGCTHISSGDTLIVRNGNYTMTGGGSYTNSITGMPSGTSNAYTKIMAETPFGVTITNGSSSLWYYESPIYVTSRSYVEVDGFVIKVSNTAYPPTIVEVGSSNHIKIKRVIVKRSGTIDDYVETVAAHASTYILFEDCAIVGAMRYGFFTGGTSDTSRYIIFRRCVVRNDYSNSNQPKASFAVYGNNSGVGVQDVLFQNCIAIDGQDTGYNGGSEGCYGGFLNPKNAKNVTYQGCIALNVGGVQGGMTVKEQEGTGISLVDTVIWNCGTRGLRAAGYFPDLIINRCTIGANPSAFHQTSSGAGKILRNTLIYNNTSFTDDLYDWDISTNNGFSPASQAIGSNAITTNLNMKYITRIEGDSSLYGAGDDGGNIGATIVKKYGVDGTLWGENGYNTLTTVDLWPWPNESSLKAIFSETNNPPSGATPQTNNTTRGFCSASQNLTNYIWTYLGNPNPYAGAALRPAPPVIIGITSSP